MTKINYTETTKNSEHETVWQQDDTALEYSEYDGKKHITSPQTASIDDPDFLRNLPNCAYYECPTGFRHSSAEKFRILFEYNGGREYLYGFISKKHSNKLKTILSNKKYSKYTIDDFKQSAYKKQDEKTRHEITKIITDNFSDELIAIGLKPDQIEAIHTGGKRADFIRKTATENADELIKAGLTRDDIAEMKRTGLAPKGFNVHHKFNRFHITTMNIDYNAPENLILISNAAYDNYHKAIHAYVDQQTDTILDKQTDKKAPVNLIWVPGRVYNPQEKKTKEEIFAQSAAEMQVVFRPQNDDQKKQLETITAGMTASGIPVNKNPYTALGYIMSKNNTR